MKERDNVRKRGHVSILFEITHMPLNNPASRVYVTTDLTVIRYDFNCAVLDINLLQGQLKAKLLVAITIPYNNFCILIIWAVISNEGEKMFIRISLNLHKF